MKRRSILCLAVALSATRAFSETSYRDIDAPPHLYRTRTPTDRFTRMKDDIENGRIALDRTSEKAFLESLLAALHVPASSQMLVFSTTSLQLRLISPSNPRAIFFTDDLYVGYIPGGRIEVVSLDPELGAIFHIFDIPPASQPVRIERSERCMNCHASADTGFVPGLTQKSVVPGPGGGSLNAFRQEQTGHGVPFDQRLGGWYVTGRSGIADHWGNTIGRMSAGTLTRQKIEPGTLFDFARYPVATSDILPMLLLEHQAGFVNRVVEAGYRARTDLFLSSGKLDAAQMQELDAQARSLTRYILFADEVPLPAGGVEGSAAFKRDFLSVGVTKGGGPSLRDFDLRTRLFKHRCSYMIHSPLFHGLPPEMKQRIFRRIGEALNVEKPDAEYAYLPVEEKSVIRAILKATLRDLPRDW